MKIFNLIKPFLKNYKLQLFLFIFLSLLLSGIAIVIPLITGSFIDMLIKSPTIVTIYGFGVAFASINIIKVLITYFITVINAKLQCKLSYDINKYVLERLQHVRVSYFTNENLSYITQKISADSNNIIGFILGIVKNLIQNALIIVCSIIILTNIDSEIALLVVLLVLIFIFVFYFTRKPIYKSTLKYKEEQAYFYSRMLEQLEKIKLIKVYNLFQYYSRRLENGFKNLYNITLKQTRISFFFQGCEGIISMIAQISLFILGGIRIIENSLTVGMFTILSSYFSSILSSVKYFVNLSQNYLETLVSYNRIIEYINIEMEHNGKLFVDNVNNISLENVSLQLGDKIIFNDFNYKFEKGNIYCVIGENGCGKTSLLNILLGLYLDDIKGKICINDIEYELIDLYNIRETLYSYTSQEPLFINETVQENIYFSNKDITRNEIEYLLNGFGLSNLYIKKRDDFINGQTLSKTLSGGELQKISLIRQLIDPKEFVIMDEPTSALDVCSKEFLLQELLRIKNNKIIVIVTHDKEVCDIADYIISL